MSKSDLVCTFSYQRTRRESRGRMHHNGQQDDNENIHRVLCSAGYGRRPAKLLDRKFSLCSQVVYREPTMEMHRTRLRLGECHFVGNGHSSSNNNKKRETPIETSVLKRKNSARTSLTTPCSTGSRNAERPEVCNTSIRSN